MAIDPASRLVRILLDGMKLAESKAALRLKEVGKQVYDPVLYIPEEDVSADLIKTEQQTQCPLKGSCSWFSLKDGGADAIAWSYETPFDFAQQIRGFIAFDTKKVSIEEHPLSIE